MQVLVFSILCCLLFNCEILEAKFLGSANKYSQNKKPLGGTKKIAELKPESKDVCLTAECKTAAAEILRNMDPKVAPCDNFYKFACGNLINSTIIPKDKTIVDNFDLISDKVYEQLRVSIEEEIQPNESRAFTLAKNLYKACMNTTAIEKKGLQPVFDVLKTLGGWPVLQDNLWKEEDFDWKNITKILKNLGYGTHYLFDFSVQTNFVYSLKRNLVLDQVSPSLDRRYLMKGISDKIVSAFYSYMVDIAVIFGANRTRAIKEMKEVLEFKIKLANEAFLSDEERRNTTALNNPMTVKELSKKYPSIPWKIYLNSLLKPIIEIGDDEIITVAVPSFFKEFEILIKQTPNRILANYLSVRVVFRDIQYLSAIVRNRQLKLSTDITGINERQPRWKECIDVASNTFDLSIGALYVRKYFKEDSKKSAIEMFIAIKEEFRKILKEADWMDEKTRKSALEKIDSMNNFIGYPDELLDNKKLDEFYTNVEITPNDYFTAIVNFTLFAMEYSLTQLRKPVNKSDWITHGSSSTVNAFYDTSENSIQLPAGILQGILFNKDRPQYMNFAAIGWFVGHEITHGFDDEGSQFDKNGNLAEWWQTETKKKYFEKADCIVKQYGNYTVKEVGLKLNGINTQGENIADNGGIKESYLGYQNWAKQNGWEPKLPGLNYSQSQLFWITAANIWCTKIRIEELQNRIITDEHSPPEFRVLGSFSNRPEFARDFNCPLGSNMNPNKKCSIW